MADSRAADLTMLAGDCAGQGRKFPEDGHDPWQDDPAYPLRLRAALGLPDGEPALPCRRFYPGDGPCLHYAILRLTVGCVNEHLIVAESCACCAADPYPARCTACGERVRTGRAEPLYPGWTPPAAGEPGLPARGSALRRALAALEDPEG
jgi:hypothetical protein